MRSVVPLYRPEWVFRQAHALFQLSGIGPDAEHNLFCLGIIFPIQSVVVRVCGDSFRYRVQLMLRIAVHFYRHIFCLRPKTHCLGLFRTCAPVRALPAGVLAGVDGVLPSGFYHRQNISHWAGHRAVVIQAETTQLRLLLKLHFYGRSLVAGGENSGRDTFLDVLWLFGIAFLLTDFVFFVVYHEKALFFVIFHGNIGDNPVHHTIQDILPAVIALVRHRFNSFNLQSLFGALRHLAQKSLICIVACNLT